MSLPLSPSQPPFMEPLTEFWRQKGVDLNLGSVAYQLRDSKQGTNLSVARVLHT